MLIMLNKAVYQDGVERVFRVHFKSLRREFIPIYSVFILQPRSGQQRFHVWPYKTWKPVLK